MLDRVRSDRVLMKLVRPQVQAAGLVLELTLKGGRQDGRPREDKLIVACGGVVVDVILPTRELYMGLDWAKRPARMHWEGLYTRCGQVWQAELTFGYDGLLA